MTEPNRRECELAQQTADIIAMHASSDAPALIADALAAYREELLKPFVELHKDAVAYRDTRAAAALNDVIQTVRGES